MARRTIIVSDLSNRELDEKDAVKITLTFSDARKGVIVIDAHPDDPEVERLSRVGTRQARRGRRPKTEGTTQHGKPL